MDRDYICGFNQSEGGIPELIDFCNIIVRMGAILEVISVRMGAILEAISFRILAGKLSGPLFGFNSFSNFSIQ